MRRGRFWSIAFLAGAAGAGCNSTLPSADNGHRIVGTVTYQGTMSATMTRPALEVVAFPEFPPKGPPRASVAFVPPGVPGKVDYELSHIPPGSYKIIAEIVDLAPTADAGPGAMLPSGGYPSFCAIFGPSSVTILADKPVEHVDITVYDNGNDPCFSQPPPKPDAGAVDAGAMQADGPLIAPDAPVKPPDAPLAPDAAQPDAKPEIDSGVDAPT